MADCGCWFEEGERHFLREEVQGRFILNLQGSTRLCSYFTRMIADEIAAGRPIFLLGIGGSSLVLNELVITEEGNACNEETDRRLGEEVGDAAEAGG